MSLNTHPETLPWYRSHVIVGSVLAVIVQIANIFGLVDVVSADVQAEIVDNIVNGLTALFGLYAMWGRVTQKYAPPITVGKASNARVPMMFFAAPLLALSLVALPGCATLQQGPRAAADQTMLDEQVSIAVEASYQAAAQILLAQVKAGKLTGVELEKAEAYEAKAFAAVLAMRAAYDAGNSADFNAALSNALRAVAEFRTAIAA
jgi:hypothetical protein